LPIDKHPPHCLVDNDCWQLMARNALRLAAEIGARASVAVLVGRGSRSELVVLEKVLEEARPLAAALSRKVAVITLGRAYGVGPFQDEHIRRLLPSEEDADQVSRALNSIDSIVPTIERALDGISAASRKQSPRGRYRTVPEEQFVAVLGMYWAALVGKEPAASRPASAIDFTFHRFVDVARDTLHQFENQAPLAERNAVYAFRKRATDHVIARAVRAYRSTLQKWAKVARNSKAADDRDRTD
jgi:hypothetical protein